MLTQRAPVLARFTRNDATRLGIAAAILILVMTAILAADLLPEETIQYQPDDVARSRYRRAPGDLVRQRGADRAGARPTPARRSRRSTPTRPTRRSPSPRSRRKAFDARVARIDTAFGADLTPEERTSILEVAVPDLPETVRDTLVALDAAAWAAIRTEAARILDRTVSVELLDTDVRGAPDRGSPGG